MLKHFNGYNTLFFCSRKKCRRWQKGQLPGGIPLLRAPEKASHGRNITTNIKEKRPEEHTPICIDKIFYYFIGGVVYITCWSRKSTCLDNRSKNFLWGRTKSQGKGSRFGSCIVVCPSQCVGMAPTKKDSANGGSGKMTKEEERLLLESSRHVSGTTSALFYGNAFIVSVLPACESLLASLARMDLMGGPGTWILVSYLQGCTGEFLC